MAFNRGMIGVAIVLISLFGSVALGVLTNIDTKTVTKDVDEYVADITGGFTGDKTPTYSSYNVSANYNGYTNRTSSNRYPVDFEPSAYTNNYPFTYYQDSIESSYTTIQSMPITKYYYDETGIVPGSYPHAKIESRWRPLQTPIDNPDDPGYPYNTKYISIKGPYGYILPTSEGPSPSWRLQSYQLNDIFNVCLNEASDMGETPLSIKITIPATVLKYTITDPYPSYPWDITFSKDVYYLSNIATASTISSEQRSIYGTQDYLRSLGEGAIYVLEIEYNIATNIISTYINNNLVSEREKNPNASGLLFVYDERLFNQQLYVWGNISQSYDTSDPPYHTHGYDLPHQIITLPNGGVNVNDVHITYTTERHRAYLDTRYGVGIPSSSDVQWTNNQKNGDIALAMSVWDSSTKSFISDGTPYNITGVLNYYGSTNVQTFNVQWNMGRAYISLNNGPLIDIGNWNQIQININTISGDVIVSPIQNWNNFDSYQLFGTSINVGTILKGDIRSISWTAIHSPRIGVVDTMVFFNSYGVIMVDPHITITNLWPNYSRFMIDVTKVATIGDSITIGENTYPISNGNLRINNTDISVTDMKMYYTKNADTWTVSIESNKKSTQISVTNTYLQFNGLWYFTAGFYEIVSKQVQERVWDIMSYNWVESNMFFWMMIIIALLSVVAYKMQLLDGMSIGILICAEVLLMLIGGTT